MDESRVEAEIRLLLQHGLEQTDAYHAATSGKLHTLTDKDFPKYASQLIANNITAIRKLAVEIDELWARKQGPNSPTG